MTNLLRSLAYYKAAEAQQRRQTDKQNSPADGKCSSRSHPENFLSAVWCVVVYNVFGWQVPVDDLSVWSIQSDFLFVLRNIRSDCLFLLWWLEPDQLLKNNSIFAVPGWFTV